MPFPNNGIRTSGGPNPAFGGTRVNDFPSMAVDKSGGPYNGRIYIAYPEEVNGRSVIRVKYSNSEGSYWSLSKTVSVLYGTQSWFPWIAVDQQKGWVSVVYYALDGSGYQTDTYVATSFDGGSQWYNAKVSDISHVTSPLPGQDQSGYAGDYIGLAAYGGKAYPTWMDDRNGTWQIYFSPLTFSGPPLSVSVSGPQYIFKNSQGTYTATASGGIPPYSYFWNFVYMDCAPGSPDCSEEGVQQFGASGDTFNVPYTANYDKIKIIGYVNDSSAPSVQSSGNKIVLFKDYAYTPVHN